jgi:hypothetical protein
LFVEPAAGTGKTTALVGRIVALLRVGVGSLDRVVAVEARACQVIKDDLFYSCWMRMLDMMKDASPQEGVR